MIKKSVLITGILLVICIGMLVTAIVIPRTAVASSDTLGLIMFILSVKFSLLGIIALVPLIIGSYFIKRRGFLYMSPVSVAALSIFYMYVDI